MDSILLQKQVRDNSEELRTYLKDLSSWEDDIKRKESSNDNKKQRKDTGSKKIKKQQTDVPNNKRDGRKPQRIKSYDYKAWDNFDVDAECERLDEINDGNKSESPAESSDSDFDPSEEYQQRLRDEASYEKERGNQFVKLQKWSEAIACYTHAIACYPKDPIYFANRALCHLKKNDLHSAEADCTSALQFDPNYVKAMQRRAAARIGLKQYNEALEDLKKILQLEPNNKESKKELVSLERILGNKQSKSTENVLKYVPPTDEEQKISKPVPKQIVPKISQDSQNVSSPNDNKKVEEKTTEIKIPWPIRPTSKTIKTVQKLPHQRSKTPLHKIQVIEVTDEPKELDNLNKASNSVLEKSVNTPKPDLASDFGRSNDKGTKIDNLKIDFTVPKTSVQFLKSWKLMKNKNDKLNYLKNIKPRNLPEIFQEAMESDVFADILDVLQEYLHDDINCHRHDKCANNIYEWLCSLSSVKRFATLVMFMSSKEKQVLTSLFEYCECTLFDRPEFDEIKILKKKYEI